MQKCKWALASPIEERYHDYEWGVPIHDDRVWFEFLLLEGAQAGLSWQTILKKRSAYRDAFDNFDVQKIAGYSQEKLAELQVNAGLVRNRLKLESAVTNAQAFLAIQSEFGQFNDYIWPFVGGKPRLNQWQTPDQVPATSSESDALSKDLKKRGFKFVGSTICYAYMQATGMVNDHTTNCVRHCQIQQDY